MTQVMVSQAKEDFRFETDDFLPPVRADAAVEASRLLADVLAPAMRIDGDQIVVSKWALHRLAMRLEQIAARGFEQSP